MTIEESAQAQAARATVRSEKDSSERSMARPVTHGGWVPQLAGSASCSLPGWRPDEPPGAAVSRLTRSPGQGELRVRRAELMAAQH